MGRRYRTRCARGLCWVWIALTHLPTSASTYVNQPLVSPRRGWEGFIYLSALFTDESISGWPSTTATADRRDKLCRGRCVYGYHALLLRFHVLSCVPIASRAPAGTAQPLDFISWLAL